MNECLDQLRFEMQLCGMSPVSQSNYSGNVQRFLDFCRSKPIDLKHDHVRTFLHHLRYQREYSIGTVNDYHTAIKFFFEVVLEKAWNGHRIPRLKGYHTVPFILSVEQVQHLLQASHNLKQRAFLSTVYGSGLRIGEACRLEIGDIRSQTMQIFVRAGKGRRERYTILARSSLELLRQYYQHERPSGTWLFPGEPRTRPISSGTAAKYLAAACSQAGLSGRVTMHTLRHSFAAHFIEADYSIYALKDLLGHASIVSTARYVQLARPDKRGIQSPLDVWPL
jgi:integrase/recombinase XerD